VTLLVCRFGYKTSISVPVGTWTEIRMPFTVDKTLRYPAAQIVAQVLYTCTPSACHLRLVESALDRPGQRIGHSGRYDATVNADCGPLCLVQQHCIVYYSLQDFTDKWDDATGKAITTCAENKRYCPSEQWLRSPRTFSLWAEGAHSIKQTQHCMLHSTFCLLE
jgi:hypothetical protein